MRGPEGSQSPRCARGAGGAPVFVRVYVCMCVCVHVRVYRGAAMSAARDTEPQHHSMYIWPVRSCRDPRLTRIFAVMWGVYWARMYDSDRRLTRAGGCLSDFR